MPTKAARHSWKSVNRNSQANRHDGREAQSRHAEARLDHDWGHLDGMEGRTWSTRATGRSSIRRRNGEGCQRDRGVGRRLHRRDLGSRRRNSTRRRGASERRRARERRHRSGAADSVECFCDDHPRGRSGRTACRRDTACQAPSETIGLRFAHPEGQRSEWPHQGS
jgi:hypothetical protein